MQNTTLYYVYDPMCSWCWGYRKTWLMLEQALKPFVTVKYRLGGLAPDCHQPMSQQMKSHLQQTWRTISKQLNVDFNFDFWLKCHPRRSTYPACRAALIARKFDTEAQMYFAIQQAYYLNAQNPSDDETLISLAHDIGIPSDEFATLLNSPQIQDELLTEIERVHQWPITGFPSLILMHEGHVTAIEINYKQWQDTFSRIKQLLD